MRYYITISHIYPEVFKLSAPKFDKMNEGHFFLNKSSIDINHNHSHPTRNPEERLKINVVRM